MKKIKQIAAIIMCVILVGMYVASFIAAVFAKPQAHGLFMGSVGLTIMLPLLLYAYTIIYRVLHPDTSVDDEKESDIYSDDEDVDNEESDFDSDDEDADEKESDFDGGDNDTDADGAVMGEEDDSDF